MRGHVPQTRTSHPSQADACQSRMNQRRVQSGEEKRTSRAALASRRSMRHRPPCRFRNAQPAIRGMAGAARTTPRGAARADATSPGGWRVRQCRELRCVEWLAATSLRGRIVCGVACPTSSRRITITFCAINRIPLYIHGIPT